MTTPIYAVAITDEKISGSLFELSAHFYAPEGGDGELTYVSLCIGDTLVEKSDPKFIASIPVSHPAGVWIEEHNWAGFFYQWIRMKPDMKIDMRTEGTQAIRGYTQIQSRMSFGYYYFEIKSLHGHLGIIVDRPEGTWRPTRTIPGATILKHPWKDPTSKTLQYNDLGIYVSDKYASRISQSRDEDYRREFFAPMTPLDVLRINVEGINSELLISFLKDDKPKHDQIRDQDEMLELSLISLYGLSYLESKDEKVIILLQKDPVKAILSAFQNMIWAKEEPDVAFDSYSLQKLKDVYGNLIDTYILHIRAKEKEDAFARRCFDILMEHAV